MADINTTSAAADERQKAVEQLYLRNFSMIRELCESDPTLNFDTTEKMAEALAGYLSNYSGPLTPEAFQEWITGIVLPALSFHAIRRACEPFVRAAIWRTLEHSTEPNKYDDYSETVRELQQEVWCWVFLHRDKLKTPGTAKMTTRVYERAAIMTKAWLKKQRTRRAAVIRQLYDLPRKSKSDAAEKIAAQMDREVTENAALEAEAKEIQAEMKKECLAA